MRFRAGMLGAGNLAGLEASGSDVHLATMAVDDDVHTLDIGTELAVGDTVGVADGTAGDRVLAANLANLRHCRYLLGRQFERRV